MSDKNDSNNSSNDNSPRRYTDKLQRSFVVTEQHLQSIMWASSVMGALGIPVTGEYVIQLIAELITKGHLTPMGGVVSSELQ